MVTDEDRDYMYQLYAKDPQARINLGIRRRLAPLLQNDRNRMNLLNGLLFSFPGTPVIYYGDEIHMGDNIYLGDRNGVRTPMQWSADRNAGFSKANPQRLYLPVIIDPEYHYEALNVEQQQNNTHSPLWWTKRIVALRRRVPGLRSRDLRAVSRRRIAKFSRTCAAPTTRTFLVVANLSRFALSFTLDLVVIQGARRRSRCSGAPTFPRLPIGAYTLTARATRFLLVLARRKARHRGRAPPTRTWLRHCARRICGTKRSRGEEHPEVTEELVRYIRSRRWFLGKDRTLIGARIIDTLPVGDGMIGITCDRVRGSEHRAVRAHARGHQT